MLRFFIDISSAIKGRGKSSPIVLDTLTWGAKFGLGIKIPRSLGLIKFSVLGTTLYRRGIIIGINSLTTPYLAL